MASRFAIWAALAAVTLTGSVASAIPISVTVDDYAFTFDTEFLVNYQFNGAAPDVLTTAPQNATTEVGLYRYLGIDGATDMLGNPIGFYPVWGSAAPLIFGGDLELEMVFNGADGPYTAPGGDQLDISLTGTADAQTPSVGYLRVTGIIGTPTPSGNPITLLEIQFDATSLIARAGEDVADLVEGIGTLTQLLGVDVTAQGRTGVVTMKLYADGGAVIFPIPPAENYDPMQDHGLSDLLGRIAGEAGIPEPASLSVLLLGAVAVICTNRRWRTPHHA